MTEQKGNEEDEMLRFAREQHALPPAMHVNDKQAEDSVLEAIAWLKGKTMEDVIKRRETVMRKIEN